VLAQSQSDQSAIPSDAEQAKALELIREVYGKEWEVAKTSVQKDALATKLLQKADESTDDTNRYVLLKVARDVAAQAGDADLAFRAIEAMSSQYEVDAYELRRVALLQAAKSATLRHHRRAVAIRSLELICEAVKKDDFDAARDFGGLGADSARKAREYALVKQIDARKEEVEEIAEAHTDIPEALATLRDVPDDPDANLVVGKYRCFFKNDWDWGLPMLALGGDGRLKELAVKELQDVSDAETQVSLGDAWWDLAATSEGVARRQLQSRAGYWYKRALPGLKEVLVADRTRQRLAKTPYAPAATTAARPKGEQARRPRGSTHQKLYQFLDEASIRDDWDLSRRWRVEGNGLRLLSGGGTRDGGRIVSKDRFSGDFVLDVALKETHTHHHTDVSFGLCGEDVKLRVSASEGIRLQRTGDTLLLARSGKGPTQIKIKQAYVNQPTNLRIQVVFEYGTGGGFWVMAVGFRGEKEPTR
jgi:hypothetical protein